MSDPKPKPAKPNLNVPFFWPLQLATDMAEQGMELAVRNVKFLDEELLLHGGIKPKLATEHTVRLKLRTLDLCDYSAPGAKGIPTLVNAPYAGHTSMIADYHEGQSLMQTLKNNGVGPLFLTDWHSATPDMKDLEVDQYLGDFLACIDDLGGRVNLVGLCQGGWMAAMLAARFPDKVASLVLAGSPIDTHAGHGPLLKMVKQTPMSFYEELVESGGGLMLGKYMLAGWKNMHPEQHYVQEHIDLYEHIDDPVWLSKTEAFERWYENPLNLPGRWYLQVIDQLFRRNLLAKGQFIGQGRALHLKDITCPLYLLAGESDDITPHEQVFAAESLCGTPASQIEKRIVPGGHVGLFMGKRTLDEAWPQIGAWIKTNGVDRA
ncbi:MAG: esterase [Thiomonas sp. 20-64-9]|jgi:poly(3-hydroxyalkanoate) synthetase|uniref:alpha/beta fold hydrolase n=1 Tax=Thiomonas sp. TaxID=2047785 RepID=UPI000BD44E21|nr:alpha/beta fold hydrolase [Thiomonas sp.]OYV30164.1 MAG: esterase [Thiomonas sp. 20-64-9]